MTDMIDRREDDYPCVGICMADPDSGYCLGCGRPPLPVLQRAQRIVAEEVRRRHIPGEEPDRIKPLER